MTSRGPSRTRLFHALRKLEVLRARDAVFDSRVPFYMAQTGDISVLCLVRRGEKETAMGIFNFSRDARRIRVEDSSVPDTFTDMLSGEEKISATSP